MGMWTFRPGWRRRGVRSAAELNFLDMFAGMKAGFGLENFRPAAALFRNLVFGLKQHSIFALSSLRFKADAIKRIG